MLKREKNVSRAENTFRYKNLLNLFGNIFASYEANFVSATMFPEMGKQENIDRKHNVSAHKHIFRSFKYLKRYKQNSGF